MKHIALLKKCQNHWTLLCSLGYPDVLKVLISDAGGVNFAMKEREGAN
jgi:hypothetical protein